MKQVITNSFWRDDISAGNILSTAGTSEYIAMPFSDINNWLNTSGDVPSYAYIAKIQLQVTAAFSNTYSGNFRLKIGYGTSSSITGTTLLNETIAGSSSSGSKTFTVDLDMINNKHSFSAGVSGCNYVTFNFYTDSGTYGKKTYSIDSAKLIVWYGGTRAIEAVNAIAGDTVCILDKYDNNVGASYDEPYNNEGFAFYAKSCDGRKITKVELFFSSAKDGWTYFNTLDPSYIDGGTLSLGNGADIFDSWVCDYKLKCVVYFEEPPTYAIYVGQTKALRAYVGQQEILNIL